MDPFRVRFKIFLIIFLSVIVSGTVGFMIIEDLSLADALYFSIVTLATVGYGDIHPVTLPGKIFAIVMIVMGVGTFLGVVANATEMMLNKREKMARLEKMNMVIGTFFSEVGRQLLVDFSAFDPQMEVIRRELIVTNTWTESDFSRVDRLLQNHIYTIDTKKYDLETLKDFLSGNRDFLLRLLENPTLLEHEAFTELLQAVFHLTEELSYREDVLNLPDTDREHLSGDIKRAYSMLVRQWLHYMKYLKYNYPYLFSLALRTNPFDRESSPIVK